MGNSPSATRLRRYLPQVFFTTFVVLILPVILAWELRSVGAINSTLSLMIVGVLLSLLIGWIGRKYWESRPGSGDLLFGDLMIWGFVRRWLTERRLESASALLGLQVAPRPGEPVRSRARQPAGLNQQQRARNLEQLAGALEARDPYTHGHSGRVARYAAQIAKTMGLTPSEVDAVRTAAAVHDVGKIDTPLEVLNKPDKLTDEEFAEVKKHSLRGAQLVHQNLDPKLAQIVVHHHERLDGTGYPTGLKGNQIPLGARIISVADTFDALTSSRAYRGAKPHRKALQILNKEAGTQLDPAAVRAFNDNYSGFRPLAVWALVTAFPQRMLSALFGQLNAATGAASTAKALAATAAAVGTGSAIAGTPPVDHVPAAPASAVALERSAAPQAPGHLGVTPVGPPAGVVRPGGSSGGSGHTVGGSGGGSTGSAGSGSDSDGGSGSGNTGSTVTSGGSGSSAARVPAPVATGTEMETPVPATAAAATAAEAATAGTGTATAAAPERQAARARAGDNGNGNAGSGNNGNGNGGGGGNSGNGNGNGGNRVGATSGSSGSGNAGGNGNGNAGGNGNGNGH